mgnify:CR=1 FL=1
MSGSAVSTIVAASLARRRSPPRIAVHGTPRQWRDPERPWLAAEKDRCVEVLAAAGIELREYAVALGAIVATLTELVEPFGLNDNLTIPFFASLAMQWGFARIQSCASEPPLHWILNGDMWTQLQRLPLA